MTATAQPYSQVYNECYKAFSHRLVENTGETPLGGPLEKAFLDLDAILGPKQGLRVVPASMHSLADHLTLLAHDLSPTELYQTVVNHFHTYATCNGEKLRFTSHSPKLTAMCDTVMLNNIVADGGMTPNEEHMDEIAEKFGLKRIPKRVPEQPPAPITQIETAAKGERKWFQFLTHDAEGIFSAPRAGITAVVAALGIGIAAAARKHQLDKREQATESEISL